MAMVVDESGGEVCHADDCHLLVRLGSVGDDVDGINVQLVRRLCFFPPKVKLLCCSVRVITTVVSLVGDDLAI